MHAANAKEAAGLDSVTDHVEESEMDSSKSQAALQGIKQAQAQKSAARKERSDFNRP